VKCGRSIVVQPNPEASRVEIETFLMGTIAGILLHQRGIMPLHGSCVEINDAAIALTGPSGRGKSTLAAALARR
jgi:serine kinase of HPr protein (carbohydrate metabolism regulator)